MKDGSVGLLLSVSAVNFALLFETEQVSIIDSFAGLINSLSFPIQIVIYSRVLDVSSYLHTVDQALLKQTNPLLVTMTREYRAFVEKSIKDNNVLDKRFYVCLKITPIEIGLLPSSLEEKVRKVTVLLVPRRDHLIRQLNRLGLKPKQLTSEQIIKLFYEIYNSSLPTSIQPVVKTPAEIIPPKLRPIRTDLNPPPVSMQPAPQPVPQPIPPLSPTNSAPMQTPLSSPFVVEELADE